MIDDVRKATETMAKTIKGIRDKFGLESMTPPTGTDIDPKKLGTDRLALQIEHGLDLIEAQTRFSETETQPEILLYSGTQ